MNDANRTVVAACTANSADYTNRTPILPGDHVMKRGGRNNGKLFLVVGIHYFGGDYRLDLRAVSGGVRNSSAMGVDQAAYITVSVDPYAPMFGGPKAVWHGTQAFHNVSAHLGAAGCRAVCEAHGGKATFGNMLRALRDRYVA